MVSINGSTVGIFRVPWQEAVKRLIDLVGSSVALLVALPLFLLITLAIRLGSSGPALFCQFRRGKGGNPFPMLKFRSMRVDAETRRKELSDRNEAESPLFKLSRDPRITRSGRLLRRSSLDELPQLINVLRGEMSLVGPRPLPVQDLENVRDMDNSHWVEERESMKPGMTGLWQILGRGEQSYGKLVQLDCYYVRNWSLLLDLQILLKTIPAVLRGKGAY